MPAYYIVKVKVRTTNDESGKVKEHIETFLVGAETTEDAGFKTRGYYGSETRDYDIASVSETKIIAVID